VSSLEQIAVGPSHYEVTVVTITSAISVCKNKFGICEGGSFEEELVENGQESNRVRLWAHATIIIPNSRVRHMTFVIRRVKINPIPTRGEVYLRSQCFALMGRKPVVSSPVTETHERNSSLCQIAVVVRSSCSFSGNHPESIRKSQRHGIRIARPGSRMVVASPDLIIHRRPAPRHQLPQLVRPLMIHGRNPIVAVVDGLVAGGDIGDLVGIRRAHEALERVATDDVVNVAAGHARCDDGVRPLNSEGDAVHGEGALARSTGDEE